MNRRVDEHRRQKKRHEQRQNSRRHRRLSIPDRQARRDERSGGTRDRRENDGGRRDRPFAARGKHAQRNRRRDPQACGQQMPARHSTFGSPLRDRDHAAERAGPEDGGVPEQHAKQHRETGATPWMQREVAKVHIGRLEHQAEHSLEACQHQAQQDSPCQLRRDEARGLAGRPPCLRAQRDSQADRPRHRGGDEPCRSSPADEQGDGPAQWPSTRNYKREPPDRTRCRHNRRDGERELYLAGSSPCRRTTIEQGTDRQQEGESELHQDDGRQPALPGATRGVELRWSNGRLHQRLAVRSAHDEGVAGRPIARAFDPQPQRDRHDRCGHEEVARDRAELRCRGRRRDHVLYGRGSQPCVARGIDDGLDVDEAQPQRRWRHEQGRRPLWSAPGGGPRGDRPRHARRPTSRRS